jgi:hypothetical protein
MSWKPHVPFFTYTPSLEKGISNLGHHIDNFHAGVDMVTVLVIRLLGKRLFSK